MRGEEQLNRPWSMVVSSFLASARSTLANADASPSPPMSSKSPFFSAHLGKLRRRSRGRNRDEHGDVGRIVDFKQALQFLDLFKGAFGTAGHGVGEEIDVFEPDQTSSPKHGDRLQGFPEPVHRGLDFTDVIGKAVDRLAGKLVIDLLGQLIVALATEPTDEEIVGTADESEGFGVGHIERRSRGCRLSEAG